MNFVMDYKQMYGEQVKGARTAKGITQAQLAEQAGASLTYISMIEQGRRYPSLVMKWRIYNVLGVEVECPACGTMLKEGEK